jgi:hypothetical protein
MEFVEDSIIKLDLEINAADALRAYLVLGRTNGYVKGFATGLYNAIAEALNVESFHNRQALHDLARNSIGVVEYINMQRQVEQLFFASGNNKRHVLKEKVSELEKLQKEVDKLKRELGTV